MRNGGLGELPLHLRREQILIKYLLKIVNQSSNAASDILIDKKYFQIGVNAKSPFKFALNSFQKENNISIVTQANFFYKKTPEFSLDEQIDSTYLDYYNNHKNTIINDTEIHNVMETLTIIYDHIIFVDGSVTSEGKVGAAIFSPSLSHSEIFRLPDNFSIYYAEAYALLQGLKFANSL